MNSLAIQPFKKIRAAHSVHERHFCEYGTIPKQHCLQRQTSASFPVRHHLPACTAYSAFHKYKQHSKQQLVNKRRPKATLPNSPSREGLAPRVLKLAAVTNGLSGRILLSLIPATKPDEPARRKHFPYCCSEKGADEQKFRIELLHQDLGKSLAGITKFRIRSLINCLPKCGSSAVQQSTTALGMRGSSQAHLWHAVLSAALPLEMRDHAVPNSLCSGGDSTPNHILKLSENAATDPYI